METQNNIFNNDDLNVGVIFKDEFEGNTIKCKLFMNDENIEMDNGLLSIYCMMDNNKMPENVYLSLNDNYNGDMFVKVYFNDKYCYDKRLGEVDCDEMWMDYKDSIVYEKLRQKWKNSFKFKFTRVLRKVKYSLWEKSGWKINFVGSDWDELYDCNYEAYINQVDVWY